VSIADDDLKEPRSSEQLVLLRSKAVTFMLEMDIKEDPEPVCHPALDRLRDSKIEFTCDGCDHAPVCAYAFDPYNTDGDCLASK
jgi:hypothetical protein